MAPVFFSRLACALSLPLLLQGCVMTKAEGKQIESDLRTVEQELAVGRLKSKQNENELRERLQTTEEQVARMNKALEATDRTARQADADFYLKLDEMIVQMRQISGRLDEIEHRLQQLETQHKDQQASATPLDSPATPAVDAPPATTAPAVANTEPAPADTPALPEDKRALYDLGKKQFDEGDYEASRKTLAVFVKRFPDDDLLTDNAVFWTAESFYKQSTYDQAILTYQKVINTYQHSDKTDACLYKIGRSFEALGLKEDAALFYEDLVSKFPRSHLVADAKKRIAAAKPKKKRRRRRGR